MLNKSKAVHFAWIVIELFWTYCVNPLEPQRWRTSTNIIFRSTCSINVFRIHLQHNHREEIHHLKWFYPEGWKWEILNIDNLGKIKESHRWFHSVTCRIDEYDSQITKISHHFSYKSFLWHSSEFSIYYVWINDWWLHDVHCVISWSHLELGLIIIMMKDGPWSFIVNHSV